jgi:S1-C subfamily serine protease
LAGSGVVVGEGLVLTNAHVVAGIRAPLVYGKDGLLGAPAFPVLFDPDRDTALLRVPGLDLPAVPFAHNPEASQLVAVAGYPNGGEQQVKAARVRGSVTATGSNIYGQGQSQRQVLVIAGEVIPGDSGGPLLNQEGKIVGLIFAAAISVDGHTGYALTADEAARSLAAAPGKTRVDTGTCAPRD